MFTGRLTTSNSVMRGGVVAYTQGDGLHARGNDGSKCCPHNRFDSRPGFLFRGEDVRR